jgi:hypothetical protein
MAAKSLEMSKRRIAESCNVSGETVRVWCNVVYFEKLQGMGYYKTQKIFTPEQWRFLTAKLVIVDD